MIVRPVLGRDQFDRSSEAIALGISQPTHSWLAAELARQWDAFESSALAYPMELLTAAALHDFGYSEWERHPTWNPQTGLPFSFQELPCQQHLLVWRRGFAEASPISRYAALFVAKHTTHLAESHSLAHHPDEEELVRNFLKKSREEEQVLIDALRQEAGFAPYLAPEKIDRQQKLIAAWDALSLYLCGALGEREELEDVPLSSGLGRLQLAPDSEDASRLTVAPWPFVTPEIRLHADARVFTRRFLDQSDLDGHFSSLETVTLSLTLRPGC